jgi:DNA-binding response OmpR family regulator
MGGATAAWAASLVAAPAHFRILIILTRWRWNQTMSGDRLAETPVLIGQGTGPLQGGRWPLTGETLLIGRGAECDIIVSDRQVSRHHARVRRVAEGEYEVEDLGSKNGTHLNGVALLKPHRLVDGDVVQIALAAKLLYVGSEATMPLAPEEEGRAAHGRVSVDRQAHRIWVAGRELEPPLSPPQYRLLDLLVTRAGQVVSREEIVTLVWEGSESEGISEQAIDALVRRLRDRLAEADPGHTYVTTVRGHGFRLDERQ